MKRGSEVWRPFFERTSEAMFPEKPLANLEKPLANECGRRCTKLRRPSSDNKRAKRVVGGCVDGGDGWVVCLPFQKFVGTKIEFFFLYFLKCLKPAKGINLIFFFTNMQKNRACR